MEQVTTARSSTTPVHKVKPIPDKQKGGVEKRGAKKARAHVAKVAWTEHTKSGGFSGGTVFIVADTATTKVDNHFNF